MVLTKSQHILAARKGVYAKYADENVMHGQNRKIRLSKTPEGIKKRNIHAHAYCYGADSVANSQEDDEGFMEVKIFLTVDISADEEELHCVQSNVERTGSEKYNGANTFALLHKLHQFVPPWVVFSKWYSLEPVEFYDVVQWLKTSSEPQPDLISRWQSYLTESIVWKKETGRNRDPLAQGWQANGTDDEQGWQENCNDDKLEKRWQDHLKREADRLRHLTKK
ncbi:hypothetical protein B0H13DRAFT_1918565 [Mycena leptocephala]|nr:hypothetical protein B0H13DRAFT_1918565 [Mycena leptocephala]